MKKIVLITSLLVLSAAIPFTYSSETMAETNYDTLLDATFTMEMGAKITADGKLSFTAYLGRKQYSALKSDYNVKEYGIILLESNNRTTKGDFIPDNFFYDSGVYTFDASNTSKTLAYKESATLAISNTNVALSASFAIANDKLDVAYTGIAYIKANKYGVDFYRFADSNYNDITLISLAESADKKITYSDEQKEAANKIIDTYKSIKGNDAIQYTVNTYMDGELVDSKTIDSTYYASVNIEAEEKKGYDLLTTRSNYSGYVLANNKTTFNLYYVSNNPTYRIEYYFQDGDAYKKNAYEQLIESSEENPFMVTDSVSTSTDIPSEAIDLPKLEKGYIWEYNYNISTSKACVLPNGSLTLKLYYDAVYPYDRSYTVSFAESYWKNNKDIVPTSLVGTINQTADNGDVLTFETSKDFRYTPDGWGSFAAAYKLGNYFKNKEAIKGIKQIYVHAWMNTTSAYKGSEPCYMKITTALDKDFTEDVSEQIFYKGEGSKYTLGEGFSLDTPNYPSYFKIEFGPYASGDDYPNSIMDLKITYCGVEPVK